MPVVKIGERVATGAAAFRLAAFQQELQQRQERGAVDAPALAISMATDCARPSNSSSTSRRS